MGDFSVKPAEPGIYKTVSDSYTYTRLSYHVNRKNAMHEITIFIDTVPGLVPCFLAIQYKKNTGEPTLSRAKLLDYQVFSGQVTPALPVAHGASAP